MLHWTPIQMGKIMSELLPYRIGRRALKELKRIRKSDQVLYKKIDAAIMSIRENPYVGEMKKGDLNGYYGFDVTHVGTNYEICYALEEDAQGNIVVIILIGPRENFYAELKRYLGL